MIRTTLFSLLTFGLAAPGLAQSSLDNFEFPEFGGASKSSTDSASRNQKLVGSSAIQDTALQQSAPVVQGELNDPLAIPAVAPNHYPSTVQPQTYEPFTGYMSYGPSPVPPMLAYMVCKQNACPNVWAGFAAEHAASMAHHCSKHGCSNCGCHAQSSHKKTVHNRYKKAAEQVSEPCDQQ